MDTLVNLNKDMKVTIVFVSHDPDDKQYARNLVVLSDGKLMPLEQL
jgi:ABC-type lipoprotein export system ATPase subunit